MLPFDVSIENARVIEHLVTEGAFTSLQVSVVGFVDFEISLVVGAEIAEVASQFFFHGAVVLQANATIRQTMLRNNITN
jgi:hypothetical protein